jgi:hypothetical protein
VQVASPTLIQTVGHNEEIFRSDGGPDMIARMAELLSIEDLRRHVEQASRRLIETGVSVANMSATSRWRLHALFSERLGYPTSR